MNDSAIRVVKNVVLAEKLVDDLSSYRHSKDCQVDPVRETRACTCGADINNEKVREIKRLLNIQYLIDFK